MLFNPNNGPSTRSSRQPTIRSLPYGVPRNVSPSDTQAPRFNIPVPTLNAPKPPRSRPKLKFSLSTPFQNLSVIDRRPSTDNSTYNSIDNSAYNSTDNSTTDISTVPSADKTIQAHETYSPEAYSYSNSIASGTGNDPIRETINKMSIAAPAPSFSSSVPTTSSTSSIDSSHSPSSPHPKDFSDDVLEELDRLGEGAGGVVHKVRDTRSGAVYALKTITTREVAVKHVVRELSVISSTHHGNIVQCYGAYMSPSSSEVKIVMENCEGGSLEAVGKKIKDRGAVVGEKIAGRLAEGILQGLAYLHTKKTIHRDIKPSNILLSRDGAVKLSDFGVSGELVNSKVGTFTGTFLYMAPERISGNEYTIRSDVWSTGLSVLELVQNRFPFPDLPPIDLILHITKGEPPKLEDEPGVTWSDEMKNFIEQTLTIDDKLRPTPKEMLAHPWIVSIMRQEVHMSRWIRQVWGWPKPRRSKDNINIDQSTQPSESNALKDVTADPFDRRESNEF